MARPAGKPAKQGDAAVPRSGGLVKTSRPRPHATPLFSRLPGFSATIADRPTSSLFARNALANPGRIAIEVHAGGALVGWALRVTTLFGAAEAAAGALATGWPHAREALSAAVRLIARVTELGVAARRAGDSAGRIDDFALAGRIGARLGVEGVAIVDGEAEVGGVLWVVAVEREVELANAALARVARGPIGSAAEATAGSGLGALADAGEAARTLGRGQARLACYGLAARFAARRDRRGVSAHEGAAGLLRTATLLGLIIASTWRAEGGAIGRQRCAATARQVYRAADGLIRGGAAGTVGGAAGEQRQGQNGGDEGANELKVAHSSSDASTRPRIQKRLLPGVPKAF
jgi:hypothetical protein